MFIFSSHLFSQILVLYQLFSLDGIKTTYQMLYIRLVSVFHMFNGRHQNQFDHRHNEVTDICPDKFLAQAAYTTSILSNVLAPSFSLFFSLSLVSLHHHERGKRHVISCRANNHHGSRWRLLFALVFLLRALPFS